MKFVWIVSIHRTLRVNFEDLMHRKLLRYHCISRSRIKVRHYRRIRNRVQVVRSYSILLAFESGIILFSLSICQAKRRNKDVKARVFV
jgi:hypothetical protein